MKKITCTLALIVCMALLLAVPVVAVDTPNNNSYTISFARNTDKAGFAYDVMLTRTAGEDNPTLLSVHLSVDAKYKTCESDYDFFCEVEADNSLKLAKTSNDFDIPMGAEPVVIATVTFEDPTSISLDSSYSSKDAITNNRYRFPAAFTVNDYVTPPSTPIAVTAEKGQTTGSVTVNATGIDSGYGGVWFITAAFNNGVLRDCEFVNTMSASYNYTFTLDKADSDSTYKVFVMRGGAAGCTFVPILPVVIPE